MLVLLTAMGATTLLDMRRVMLGISNARVTAVPEATAARGMQLPWDVVSNALVPRGDPMA